MKKVVITLTGLLFVIISLNLVLASNECSIVDESECNEAELKDIVLRLSDLTEDAHAELHNETNYNKVLCCDNFGQGNRTCGGDNTIIKIESETNAHAGK